jgi:hypothetical protein
MKGCMKESFAVGVICTLHKNEKGREFQER